MAVSKRLRYEILRRDNHACRYCGACAPDVALTVDHVIPTALGGDDQPTNLVAACRDCNAGKSASSPDAPIVADVRADALRWSRAMQMAQLDHETDIEVRDMYRSTFDRAWQAWTYPGDNGERQHLPRPLDWPLSIDTLIDTDVVTEAMLEDGVDIAMRSRADDTFRFFCGVMWNKVRAIQQRAQKLVTESEPT